MLRRGLYIVLLSLLPITVFSQAMHSGASYTNIDADRYFRIGYDNDFFTGTDEYYTQGISMETVSPTLKYNPLSWVLIHPKDAHNRYGITVEHEGYTPRSIGDEQILYDNHPYAAVLMLKSFAISDKPENGQRFYTSLSTGVIGPAAGGKEMQMAIHKALAILQPGGWQNQIHNDVVLNYELIYEHRLWGTAHTLEIDANAGARAGTFSDRASIGLSMMTGYFNSPLNDNNDNKAFHLYLFEAPTIHGVVYDATLQGGMFNRSSPYTIGSQDITRLVFENKTGVVLTFKGLYAQYYVGYQSKTFNNGLTHFWGGFLVGTRL